MGMLNIAFLGPVLIGLAVIFLGLAMQDFWKTENKLTPARKTWVRIAIIFSAISIGLYVVQVITAITA